MTINSLSELTALFTKTINEMGCELELDTQRLMDITEIFYEEYQKDLSPWYIYNYFGLSNCDPEAVQYQTTLDEALVLMIVISEVYKEDFEIYKKE